MFKLQVFINELRDQRNWFLGWAVTLLSYALLITTIYPGEEGMREILKLFSDPLYEAFLGDIKSDQPSFALWNSLMGSFLSLIFSIYGFLAGVRVSMKVLSDGTGEIVNSLPVRRGTFLTSKFLAIIYYGFLLLLIWFIPIVIPINGNNLEIEIVLPIIVWGLLFIAVTSMIGVFVGNSLGSSTRGTQNSILLILFLYILQIIVNIQSVNLNRIEFWDYEKEITMNGSTITRTVPYTLTDLLNDINVMSWYNPSSAFLGEDIENKYLWISIVALLIFTFLAYFSYLRKDMINKRGWISIPRRKVGQKGDVEENVKPSKSVKKSIFVFWVRPFEKKLPFTADMVYSDRRAMLILFWASILFWPLQLLAFPGDHAAEAATSLVEGGFFLVFTYGYSLISKAPWVWWVITQTVGVHWMLLLPMTIRWIRSIPSRDSEDGTGDLVGSLPVRKKQVIYQRIFAVFLELIWVTFWFMFFYVLSVAFIESRIGSIVTPADPSKGIEEVIFKFTNPLETSWVLIAIASQIPFYMFLVTSGVFINLALKKRGLQFSRGYVLILLLLFFAAFSSGNSDYFWISGIFGMYNPVGIILEESMSPASYGVYVLIGLTFLMFIAINWTTRQFSWLKGSHN